MDFNKDSVRNVIKLSFLGVVALAIFASPLAHAEFQRPGNMDPSQFFTGSGGFNFDPAGAALLPANILTGLDNGGVPPFYQIMLANNLMSACIKKASEDLMPAASTPYMQASYNYDSAICRLRKCFQQGLLMDIIANNDTGGVDNQIMATMAQSFGDDQCADSGNDIDPAMLMMLQNSK